MKKFFEKIPPFLIIMTVGALLFWVLISLSSCNVQSKMYQGFYNSRGGFNFGNGGGYSDIYSNGRKVGTIRSDYSRW